MQWYVHNMCIYHDDLYIMHVEYFKGTMYICTSYIYKLCVSCVQKIFHKYKQCIYIIYVDWFIVFCLCHSLECLTHIWTLSLTVKGWKILAHSWWLQWPGFIITRSHSKDIIYGVHIVTRTSTALYFSSNCVLLMQTMYMYVKKTCVCLNKYVWSKELLLYLLL